MRLFYNINIEHYCGDFYYVNGHLVSIKGVPNPESITQPGVLRDSIQQLYPIYLEVEDINTLKYFVNGYLELVTANIRYKIYKCKGDSCRVAKTQYFYNGIGRSFYKKSIVDCSIGNLSFLFKDL